MGDAGGFSDKAEKYKVEADKGMEAFPFLYKNLPYGD